MSDWLEGVRALLPGTRLEFLDLLGGSRRSHVRRIRAGSRTLIVKEFTGSGAGWAREAAALSVMPSDARVPRWVADGAVPPIVVMSDAGSGASVADALLGRDRGAAAAAVASWATAIASVHRATTDSRAAFRDALGARAGDVAVPESTVSADLEDAARMIARHCERLGIDVPADALDELRALGSRLGGTESAALTPADACPDNNVRADDELVLIDFESAQWRHVAWDVAYLIVPWPSCWCSWRLPADVAEQAIEAYRTASAMAYVDSPGFRRDVDAAAVGWTFVSTSWFLDLALLDEPPLTDPNKPSPTRRSMILHRLHQTRGTAELPGLAELAARLHDGLTDRWGDLALPYAPAFNRP